MGDSVQKKVAPRSQLLAFVVEDHDEALHHIYRQIGAKKLPFHKLAMLHLDSHPDLLLPKNVDADCVFDKDALFQQLSIENWILPAVYAGHIEKIIWLKPPWSTQLPERRSCFSVGRHMDNGQLRVTSKDAYFLGELLYAPEEKLHNCKALVLHVETGGTDDLSKKETKELASRLREQLEPVTVAHPLKRKLSQDTVTQLPPKVPKANGGDLESQTPALVHDSACTDSWRTSYILDIDLDFFSTSNPFKTVFSEEQYNLVQRLYSFKGPHDDSDVAVEEFVHRRKKQLDDLKEVFIQLRDGKDVELGTSERDTLLKELTSSLKRSPTTVDYDWLHEIGTGCDDTDLPHHVSSEEEILRLMANVKLVLQSLPPPALITIARSSNDDYCPVSQVDFIQENALAMLRELYPSVKTTLDYDAVKDVK